jgi:hypothetical protein
MAYPLPGRGSCDKEKAEINDRSPPLEQQSINQHEDFSA